MTLDESDKQSEEQNNNNNNSSNNNNNGSSQSQNASSTDDPSSNDVVVAQKKDISDDSSETTASTNTPEGEESMQWASNDSNNNDNEQNNSSSNNEELDKAATKRQKTFDQISDGSSSTTSNKTEEIKEKEEIETEKSSLEMNNDKDNQKNETTTSSDDNVDDEKPEEEKESEESESERIIKEPVTFKVVYAKAIYEITSDLNDTILMLKNHLQKLTSVASSSQKLCYKGNLNDSKTLRECGLKDGVKVMMIGSKANDILAVASVTKDTVVKEAKESTPVKEPLCQQKQHKKIIEKGIPESAMTGFVGDDCQLPLEPLTGMLNKYGNKVRLTFKLEQDEVWIGTKERTQKIQMTSIKSVISEPIDNYPHYHIMALQIGPTEASRIWFYWVPAQYVRAIKSVILNS